MARKWRLGELNYRLYGVKALAGLPPKQPHGLQESPGVCPRERMARECEG